MAADRISDQSVGELQIQASHKARNFLSFAASAPTNAKEAADWSLAAKNAISIALSCEHILKTRNGRR